MEFLFEERGIPYFIFLQLPFVMEYFCQYQKKKLKRNSNLNVLSSSLYYGGHLILPGQQMSFRHQHSSLEVRN